MLTIGELAGRAGLAVKTVRFWSDEGLLPPAERTPAGYRLYTDHDLVRLDVIRTLREAGLDLDTIRRVLGRDMDLSEALGLRLRAIEAHVVSLQRVAAAIRAALRSGPGRVGPDNDDLRRLHAVTRLSNEERKAVITRFYEQVAEGTQMDPEWMRSMIDASTPDLPDEPTPEQLDAWIELSEIVTDPGFVENMREMAAKSWAPDGYQGAAAEVAHLIMDGGSRFADRGVSPESAEAGELVERYVQAFAAAMQRQADEAFRAELLANFADHDPRAARYWELVAIMQGASPEMTSKVNGSKWFAQAVLHHLA